MLVYTDDDNNNTDDNDMFFSVSEILLNGFWTHSDHSDSIKIRSVVDADVWYERAFTSLFVTIMVVVVSPFLQHRQVSWNLKYETLFQSLVLYSSSRLMLNISNS